MHEVHTARKIMRMALSRVQAQGHSTFRAVHVRIGAWTGIDIEHLKHDFETASPGVELRVELVQPSARCRDCGSSFEPTTSLLKCGVCGSTRITLDQTREIELVGVEA